MEQIEPSAFSEPETSTSTFNGVRLSVSSTPARLAASGGDWCESFAISDDVVALSIGDVSGHGIERSAAMDVTRRAVRDAARSGLDPTQILAAANRVVCRLDPDLHATALFGLLDTARGLLTFASAGHPPPLLLRRAGSSFLTFETSDMPLGVEAVLEPSLHVAGMAPETLLVLYTDGVTEHERQPLRGEAQLQKAALDAFERSNPPTAAAIEELMFLAGSNEDDVSILTVWMPNSTAGRGPASYPRWRRLRSAARIAKLKRTRIRIDAQ